MPLPTSTGKPARAKNKPRHKVAWISSWNVQCGIATYSRYLLADYPHASEDVTVLCDERTIDLSTPHGPVARIAWRLGDPGIGERIAGEVGKTDASLVVVQFQPGLLGWENVNSLLGNAAMQGRQTMIVLHTLQDLLGRSERDAVLDAFRRATRILVHNVREMDLLKGFGLVDNVTLFPHGAMPPKARRPPARELPPDSAPRIGAYGFVFAHKGFYGLTAAFSNIKTRWPNAKLRMVTAQYPGEASASEIARCRQLAASLGIEDDVEWHTDFLQDEESLALLRECDLLALPYVETSESASGAVRVAMASRVPVMVTPVPIFDEMGQALLRSESSEVAAIASGIEAALRNRRLRESTVDKADRWLETHSWGRLSRRFAGMIGSLASEKKSWV